MSQVRVRIAPSPTGLPHIGTAWQALFDYIFAKKNNGVFILRLEDTDRERYMPEAVDAIKETFEWLGLDYDEGPGKGDKFGPYVQ
jgi:glutamyl/glutaminyl-tRNA synthetase